MSSTLIYIVLATVAALAILAGLVAWTGRSKMAARVRRLNEELLEASADASVGRRLSVPDDKDTGQLATTVNRLFDALGERDEKI